MKFTLFLLSYFFLFYCSSQDITLKMAYESDSNKVLVAAHRGDWKNFPENSMPAVLSCIKNGIDIVEIDVQKTKDGYFVLMHDATLDRTSNGRGLVSNYYLSDIIKFKLKNSKKELTEYTIPRLEDILDKTDGKIIVNIDKSSGRFPELIQLVQSLGKGSHVIMKGTAKPTYFKSLYDKDSSEAYFMPIISSKIEDLNLYLMTSETKLVELLLSNDSSFCSTEEGLKVFNNYNCKIWYNALFSSISGGHNENKNAIDSWKWFINHKAYVIQTDYPFHLMQFLINENLHKKIKGFEEISLENLPNK
jgi:glycerophosphoryl diester phosphodiesterase